ncbi:MAG: L-threonylcarbamoyladenylate synthase [Flavobacteriaceae bacterium]|nr:L-threonylcarbamoyladenylate synthase [Flavobacteriaceae bacterium]
MQKIIETLQNAGVILTPTDTTFGLSCLAFDPEACNKINQIKQRPENKNFVLLVDSEARLQKYVDVPDLAWDIIDLSEKPVTIVYDKIVNIPAHLISPQNTIAIRVVKLPLLQQIIQKVNQPLVSTSANISGEKVPKDFDEIHPKILNEVDLILPESQTFKPQFEASSIIQISHDGRVKVLRE